MWSNLNPHTLLKGRFNCPTTLENSLVNNENTPTKGPRSPTATYSLKEKRVTFTQRRTHNAQGNCIRTSPQSEKPPKCPSVGDGTTKMRHVFTMGHCSAVSRNEVLT